MKIKKYIQNALAKFIFDEELDTIKLGIKVAQMPIKAEDTTTTTTPERADLIESVNDLESRVSTVEDFEYRLDEVESNVEEMKNLAEQTEESIDELKNATTMDFAEEFTAALAQPEFVTLIETLIKNEREKSKKKPKRKKA
jgi:predicted RNase H-like nuclease (RuvC/YqgF family)